MTRHAVDSSKIEKKLGWKSKIKFSDGIKETIAWYKNNQDWWRKIKEKHQDYVEFQKKWYTER